MASIELIIRIPEEVYKHTLKAKSVPDMLGIDIVNTINAVKNGTPLPKGHGRIADIDKVLEEMRATRTYDIPFALDKVKPIIEADKESEG